MSQAGYTRRTALVAGGAAATAALVPDLAVAELGKTTRTGAAMTDLTGGRDPVGCLV